MSFLSFLLGPILNIAYGVGKHAVNHVAEKAKKDVISKVSEVVQTANNYFNPSTNNGSIFKIKLVDEITLGALEKLLVEKILFTENMNCISTTLNKEIGRLERQANAKINIIDSYKELLDCLINMQALNKIFHSNSIESLENNEELKNKILEATHNKKLFFYLIKLNFFLKNTLNSTLLRYYDYPQFNLEIRDDHKKDQVIEKLSELLYQHFIKLGFNKPEFYYVLSSQIHELVNQEFRKVDTRQNKKLIKVVKDNHDKDQILRLIALGADVDTYDEDEGLSCIHMAVINNNSKVVACLLENGANPDVVAKQIYRHAMGDYRDGHRPLTIAIYYGYAELIKLLLAHNAKVNFTLQTKNKLKGRTPLILAVRDPERKLREKNEEIIGALLRHGANPNIILDEGKWKGWTALGLAVFNHSKTINNHPKIVSLLLEHEAKPNAVVEANNEWEGCTPLALAILNEEKHTSQVQLEVIKTLLDHNADPNIKLARGKWKGWTALGLAVFNYKKTISNHDKIVSLLLEHDAEPNVVIEANNEWEGWTPLALAILNEEKHTRQIQLEVIKTLLAHRADPYQKISVSKHQQYNQKTPAIMATYPLDQKIFNLFESRLQIKSIFQELNNFKSSKNFQQNNTHSNYSENRYKLFNRNFNFQKILHDYLKNALIEETDAAENKLKSQETEYGIVTFPSLELAEGFHNILSNTISANALDTGNILLEMDDSTSQYKILLSHENFQILMQIVNQGGNITNVQQQNNNNNARVSLPPPEEKDEDRNTSAIDENDIWPNTTCTIQ